MTELTVGVLRALISCLTLWGFCLVYLAPLHHRPRYGLRIALFAVVGGCVSATAAVLGLRGDWLGIAACCLFAFALLWACGEISLPTALYCGVWAVVSQQLAVEAWFLCYQYGEDIRHLGNLWWLIGALIFAVAYGVIARTFARWMPENGQYAVGPRQLSSALVLLVIFEVLFILLMDGSVITTPLYSGIVVLSQAYCVTMLYLQSALFKKSAMKHELATLNRLWYQQKAQYTLARENIALINHKCHDLKHQIAAMRCVTGSDDREKYIREIEDSVRIYDAIVQTGNEVLDTVLTEKSLYCEANRIQISCVADGSRMAFMDPVDLYAIFGNAIDNAIESVQQLHNEDKRVIDVLVYVQQRFLIINIINPLGGEVSFEDGLPISTKGNSGYHGFGLKSIRHTLEKYGGFLNVNIENSCFSLEIVIPLRDKD